MGGKHREGFLFSLQESCPVCALCTAPPLLILFPLPIHHGHSPRSIDNSKLISSNSCIIFHGMDIPWFIAIGHPYILNSYVQSFMDIWKHFRILTLSLNTQTQIPSGMSGYSQCPAPLICLYTLFPRHHFPFAHVPSPHIPLSPSYMPAECVFFCTGKSSAERILI